MKSIGSPAPGSKRKVNPYERIENIMCWAGAIVWPLFLLGLVVGFVLLWVWAVQTGQFETVEVVETVEKSVNTWIEPVLVTGGMGAIGVIIAFIFTLGRIGDLWDEQSWNWERKKTED